MEDSGSIAESLFARFLVAQQEGKPATIEDLCAAHPEVEHELRSLWIGHEGELLGLKEVLAQTPQNVSFFGRQTEEPTSHVFAFQPGNVIADFELKRLIGEGGMGQVWEAEQYSLNRKVALKLMRPDRVNKRTLALFAREARAGGRLHHASIVGVHDHGEDEGTAWIAMDLIEGSWTLRDFLQEVASKENLRPTYYRDVARTVVQIADALQSAHEAGVIHRDLKPANVLVTDDDRAMITDFGLARITDELSLSMTGDFAGTYFYMSPEQVAARRMGLDHRTDVFSLGVVLYELLALRKPFLGDTTHQVAEQILTFDPPNLHELRSKIPRDLAVICGKALEKSPGRRYQTMGEMAADLRRHLANEPILARPPGSLRKLQLWSKRNPVKSVAGGVAATAFVVILGLLADNLRTNRALAQEVKSVKRLSAMQDHDALLARAEMLWPPYPENIRAYEDWIRDAGELLGELELHRRKRQELREDAVPLTEAEAVESEQTSLKALVEEPSAWEFPESAGETSWWHEQLSKLIEDLEGLADEDEGLMGEGISPLHGWAIPRRLAAAERLRDGFGEGGEFAFAWNEAIAEIREHPAYGGLVLSPQMGLVPIGPGEGSGLWEFWHVQSGERPERSADGSLWMTEESGMVFVLLPGGTFDMGAQQHSREKTNFDSAAAEGRESPVHQVTLSTFFSSKYEMTQGQWARLEGRNPSLYGPMTGFDEYQHDLTHPVEQISWAESKALLERFGLQLPSEAQWEYATRAGSDTPWWTGRTRASLKLANAVNLADRTAAKTGRFLKEARDWPEFKDGFVFHAPVGTFAPNPFGLHEVHGNVWEWCLDSFSLPFYQELSENGLADVDPVASLDNDSVAARGGGFGQTANSARSAYRHSLTRTNAVGNVGVRPARCVTE